MRFEMKNLTSFPMETLCFDLKLEALEQMEPRDVCELSKVNQGFQGMLVRDPSIIFGKHVCRIHSHADQPKIMKFSNSNAMKLNVDRPFSDFSFVKNIRSCDHLSLWNSHQFNEKLLTNLKSVNRLGLREDSKEVLERFFSNFHASIMKEAFLTIDGSALNDQVIKDRMGNFMVAAQLKDCEKISFDCDSEDSVRVWYNALSKSQIKNVAMETSSWDCVNLLIQLIITNGIPSKNPEAAIFLDHSLDFTTDFSQYPGMRRIDGENRLRLLKQANYLARNFVNPCYDVYFFSMEKSSVFLRRLDSGKDCIYVYDEEGNGKLLAFYVPVD